MAERFQMSEDPPISLHSVSVVVTAQFHNPSILNPDFLASREIVPADWKVAETLTTPPVSVVKYENGVEWSVDQSRLTVAEQSGPGFGDSYRVHPLMVAYLRKLPHVPYRSLGLNCQVSKSQANPQRWLIERFGLRPWRRSHARSWLPVQPTTRTRQNLLATRLSFCISRRRTLTQVKTDPSTIPLQRQSAGSSPRRSSRLSGSPAVWTALLLIQLHDWLAGSPLPPGTRRSLTSCR